MLYQSQREALRAKFKEKDNFIQQLIREKEAIQVMSMSLSLTTLITIHTVVGTVS